MKTRPRQMASQGLRLLTLAQAGERVQLSRWTLRRAIERGELEGFRFGRRIRVSEEACQGRSKSHPLSPVEKSPPWMVGGLIDAACSQAR